MPDVSLIMGSDSDLPLVEETQAMLRDFDVSFETRVLSAHRAPDELKAATLEAEQNGAKVFIGFAGLAAHLPGVIASHTARPVIGVPVGGGALNGVDALYSIVQMPAGVPVASMAIGKAGAKNAALFAVQILSTANNALSKKLAEYKAAMKKTVLEKDARIRERG